MSFEMYPKDPTEGISEIIKYFDGTGDHKNLIAGVYDLVGFGLKLTFGGQDENIVNHEIMSSAISTLKGAMVANPAKMSAIPVWLKPLLLEAIQSLYIWLQLRVH